MIAPGASVEASVAIGDEAPLGREHYALRALKAGAMGYVTKMGAPQELISAIRKIMSGRPYIGMELAEFLANNVNRNQGKLGYNSLSDRELEVFEMIGRGMTTQEIARQLGLSAKTIETHRERIKVKLRLRNAAELSREAVLWMLENG